MKTKTAGSKGLSLILMIAGAVMTVAALALDFMGNKASFRGPLLVIGVIAFFLGLYLFPTLAHHRKIVYVIFTGAPQKDRLRDLPAPAALYIRCNGYHPAGPWYLLFHDRLDGYQVHTFRRTCQLCGHV